ncbi:FAD-binding oxidoreductase [Peribacillus sp. SI8-4]|uniref:FAD-binding oxidoreductase n=1 Tax=Peribacillus sp. SI8-4 TaxID=3048009 RepID=UPI002552B776|nr:FAD-binding oxidoreductase [Peribacillus sp. SI8-4]
MKRYIFAILYSIIFGLSLHAFHFKLNHPIAEDISRLMPVKMKAIKAEDDEGALKKIVLEAKENDDPISIAGMQHSQGGQTLYPNGILLDMKNHNEILDLDVSEKRITVQSGATWADVQEYINPYGLALKVSQSQNIFTIGGSLSVNVHGRDIRHHALIETVESFRLLDAKGQILTVSRKENSELFSAVIGGYGLFGIILDVTLHLTDDELYQIKTKSLHYEEYTSYFKKEVLQNSEVKMHLARISVAPGSYLDEMYVTDYYEANDQTKLPAYNALKRETIVAVPKFFLGLSRYNDWGKEQFWKIQESYTAKLNGTMISRNNVMRSDSAFMDYSNPSKTEVLQEYFVPVDQFADYIDDLRNVLTDEKDFNLLNITIRYVEQNDESLLSYAKDDMFALVMLINQGTDDKGKQHAEKVIRSMIDVALTHDGSYYLPYYGYPTKAQFNEAYPHAVEFFHLKKKYDHDDRFMNLFYKEYHP